MKVWLLVCLVPLSGALGRLLSNRDVQQNDPVIDALRSPENHGSADSQLVSYATLVFFVFVMDSW